MVAKFRNLKVWQKAHELTLNCQRSAKLIRGSEHTALRSQLVRAAMSIPANIVEGRARESEKEFSQFITYAIGSAAELEYHLVVAKDFRVLPEVEFEELLSQLEEVQRMLYGLRKTLRGGNVPPTSR
jgi:four helix bundle protein